MRIATKAVYYFLMAQFEFIVASRCILAKQFFRDYVNELRLTVHIWHIEESTFLLGELIIRSRSNSFLSQRQCLRVMLKGSPIIPEDVPRKLVENNYFGKATLWS